MVSHLTFPYSWTECFEGSNCAKAAHLDFPADQLNDDPVEWVQALLGCSLLTDTKVCWLDENGEVHRADGPAEETEHDIEWRFHGKYHRVDGPAVITQSSSIWWLNGKIHREGGPAIIMADGGQVWMFHGEAHRDDGPASISSDGTETWLRNGHLVEAEN